MEASAHEKIAEHLKPIIKKYFPDYTLATFYAGNWLTDMSQVVAPVDFAELLVETLNDAQDGSPRIPYDMVTTQFRQFVHDAFGNPIPENSRLIEFLTGLIYNMYCLKFMDEQSPEICDALQKIWDTNFTQYFPHEHLDRWPKNTYAAGNRGLYAGLDDHIDYIIEQMTLIEKEWVAITNLKKEPFQLLAKLGHVMHAVEDFFAHTNFIEQAYTRELGSEGLKSVFNKKKLEKIKLRRTDPYSKRETKVVFSGSFDGEDSSASMHQLLHDKNDGLLIAFLKGPQYSNLTEDQKKDFIYGSRRTEFIQTLDQFAQVELKTKKIPKKYRDRMKEQWDNALDNDLQLYQNHSFAVGMGCISIMDGILHDATHVHLDDVEKREGCHTLLSKDSANKLFHQEAMEMAQYVTGHLLELLMSKLAPSDHYDSNGSYKVPDRRLIDWKKVIHYFLRNPFDNHDTDIKEGKTEIYIHKVKKGESLESIARKYNVPWEDIALETFGTKEPHEINAILEKWGCIKVVDNYAFRGWEENNKERLKVPVTPLILEAEQGAQWFTQFITKYNQPLILPDYRQSVGERNKLLKVKKREQLEAEYNDTVPYVVDYFERYTDDQSTEKKDQEYTIKKGSKITFTLFENVKFGSAVFQISQVSGVAYCEIIDVNNVQIAGSHELSKGAFILGKDTYSRIYWLKPINDDWVILGDPRTSTLKILVAAKDSDVVVRIRYIVDDLENNFKVKEITSKAKNR